MLVNTPEKKEVSNILNERHIKKEGTPTIGGLIFIIPTIISIILLFLKGSLKFNHNLIILMFVFILKRILKNCQFK